MFDVAVALLYYETEFHVKGALFRPTKQIPLQVVGRSCTLREPHEPENTTMGLTQFDNDTILALWASSASPQPGFSNQAFRQPRMGAYYIEQLSVFTNALLEEREPPVSGNDG